MCRVLYDMCYLRHLTDFKELCVSITFCFLLDRGAIEMYKVLKLAFGWERMRKTQYLIDFHMSEVE